MLLRTVAIFTVLLLAGCSALEAPFRFIGLRNRPLYVVSSSTLPDDLLADPALNTIEGRRPLLQATEESLRFLTSGKRDPAVKGLKLFTAERLERSLKRFRDLLLTAPSAELLRASLRDEFLFFRSVGRNREHHVLFTAYCEPEVEASRIQTAEFQFPLYGVPAEFPTWPKPHPTRSALEGTDGRGGLLHGKELFYLRDRFDALFIQIQGSSLLSLPGGERRRVGFAAATEHPFKSIAAALIRDGLLPREEADANGLRRFFREHPERLHEYAALNNRVVMFRELSAFQGPIGSLGRPLTTGRSLASDRTLFPAGAIAIVRGDLPFEAGKSPAVESRIYFDQDTGSAIKGPGRIDLFLGSGTEPCTRAGTVKTPGELYYLLLKDG